MLLVINDCHDPYFNLAAEEYLLEHADSEVFMLWRNRPCVVIGKNQNARAEIDLQFVKENDITVVRRNSGGGAVFHDLGNVNYSCIARSVNDIQVNFRTFTAPVVQALRSLGLNAEFSGRNDIVIDDAKVSGNAQYYRGGRVLHHGTLLYAGDIGMLTGALRPDRKKIQSKGVASVRSRVVNISGFLPERQPVEWFMRYLQIQLCTADEWRGFDAAEIAAINELRASKYLTWEWNFGGSPAFDYCCEERFSGGSVCLQLAVKNGIVSAACFSGDYFGIRDSAELADRLIGVRFERGMLYSALQAADVGSYIAAVTIDDLLQLLPE